MARITPPPPLLLMVLLPLALILEGAPNTTLAPDCPADVIVKEGVTRVVFTKETQLGIDTVWYVKPGSDIKSVHFVVVGSDGSHNTAWFPVDGCFNNDEWWDFTVGTWLHYFRFGFVLRFVSGECWKGCQFNTAPPELYSLTLVAHGNSSWRKFDCGSRHSIDHEWPDSLPPCMEHPSSIPTSLHTTAVMHSPSTSILGIVMVASQPGATSPHLQLTAGQGRDPDQDEEHIYYEIMPDLSERRVVVPLPTRDPEEPVYDDVMPERTVGSYSAVY
ncbi:hypothetical protein E2C01_025982 [Portunus trituberculatus]|uniref:Uncharacterized protein n=1 Tax=Portunus trituberculatus TaxID=210409 RepID=A0A5B7EH66_PORTR|nr:hypothetical protein [Portunus trituberculatus]